jgi:hypothetical protein
LPGTEAAKRKVPGRIIMGCFEDYMDFREEVEQVKRKKDRVDERAEIITVPCLSREERIV